MRPTREFLFRHPAHFLALGFGSGLASKAPGTFGTLAALPFFFLAHVVGGQATVLLVAAVFFVAGIWASEVTGKALGVSDHGSIVVDEIAAFLLVLAFAPLSTAGVIVAFILFRVFDIVKPWPISVADRRIKGGFGVMFDDLLAAIYAIIGLWVLRSILDGVRL